MNKDTEWVVNSFLDEVGKVDVRDANPPMHVLDLRLAKVDMALTEVGDDDLECLAVRALAEATRDLYLDPARVNHAVDSRSDHLVVYLWDTS